MGLNAYNKYLEPCGFCNNNNTVIQKKLRKAKGDLIFYYDQISILCPECKFSFVTDDLSSIAVLNRHKSKAFALEMKRLHYLQGYRGALQDVVDNSLDVSKNFFTGILEWYSNSKEIKLGRLTAVIEFRGTAQEKIEVARKVSNLTSDDVRLSETQVKHFIHARAFHRLIGTN